MKLLSLAMGLLVSQNALVVTQPAALPTYVQWISNMGQARVEFEIVATSRKVAIARALHITGPFEKARTKQVGYFVWSELFGIQKLNNDMHAIWFGVGPNDAIWAADASGTLWRADDVSQAVAGMFIKLTSLAGAQFWDINPRLDGVVVAAGAKKWWVSRDSGKSFQKKKNAQKLEGIFLRRDSVIVLDQVGAAPTTSRDFGSTWKSAPTALKHLKLKRNGDLIGQPVEGDCSNGILATNGINWNGYSDESSSDSGGGLGRLGRPNLVPAHSWAALRFRRNTVMGPEADIDDALTHESESTPAQVTAQCKEESEAGSLSARTTFDKGELNLFAAKGLRRLDPFQFEHAKGDNLRFQVGQFSDGPCDILPDTKGCRANGSRVSSIRGSTGFIIDIENGEILLAPPRDAHCSDIFDDDHGIELAQCLIPEGLELWSLTRQMQSGVSKAQWIRAAADVRPIERAATSSNGDMVLIGPLTPTGRRAYFRGPATWNIQNLVPLEIPGSIAFLLNDAWPSQVVVAAEGPNNTFDLYRWSPTDIVPLVVGLPVTGNIWQIQHVKESFVVRIDNSSFQIDLRNAKLIEVKSN
jgi:hypothetical protein